MLIYALSREHLRCDHALYSNVEQATSWDSSCGIIVSVYSQYYEYGGTYLKLYIQIGNV